MYEFSMYANMCDLKTRPLCAYVLVRPVQDDCPLLGGHYGRHLYDDLGTRTSR